MGVNIDTGTAVIDGHWQYRAGLMYTPFTLQDGGSAGSECDIELTPIQDGLDRGFVDVVVKRYGIEIRHGRFYPVQGTKLTGASGELRDAVLFITMSTQKPGPGDPEDLWRQVYEYDLSGTITPRQYAGGAISRPLPPPPHEPIFSDVQPGDSFYEYVQRVASAGIIGGYDDHTFRPNNTLTRGQLCKILARYDDYKRS